MPSEQFKYYCQTRPHKGTSRTSCPPHLPRRQRGNPTPPHHAVRQRHRDHPTKALLGMVMPRLHEKHAVHLRASSASHLVDRHPVHVAVVDEPDDLVGEQLAVVLARQVRLGWLGAGRGKHRNATQHVSGLLPDRSAITSSNNLETKKMRLFKDNTIRKSTAIARQHPRYTRGKLSDNPATPRARNEKQTKQQHSGKIIRPFPCSLLKQSCDAKSHQAHCRLNQAGKLPSTPPGMF